MLLIHGNNQPAGRDFLQQLIVSAKQKNQELIRLNGEKCNLTDIIQALEAGSLFGQDKLVIIESLLSRISSREKDTIITYLAHTSDLPLLILLENKIITLSQSKKLGPKLTTRLFKIPLQLFYWLDNLVPGNQKLGLSLLHSLKTEAPELIFYMLGRRCSQLLIAREMGKPGLTKMAPWQQSKLVNQSKKFTTFQLLNLHQRLLNIDTEIKTGRSPMSIDWHLDLLLAHL